MRRMFQSKDTTLMLDPDFARTGFASVIPDGAQITRFHVLGERSSGTNYVKRLLGRNTSLNPTEALGWKHGFVQTRAIPADLLVVGVVRRADDWLRSMHAKPWHCSPTLQSLEFSKFIRAEWDTIIDRPRYFDGAEAAGEVGQPLMQDRHPLTGARFENLLALRQAKLHVLLSFTRRDCAFILLRMEDVIAAPEQTLARITTALNQPITNQTFRPVVKRLGSKFKPSVPNRPETPTNLPEADKDWMRSAIDIAQERHLGYLY